MSYPFIYLRVYYRGFQDSTISKMTWFFLWPVVGITGGSMATVHRSWLVQGQNFVACTRLLTHLVMGWPACLDRDFTTAGGPMLCFFGKCPICPMIQCCVFFLDSYLEGGWRWRWWYDWWWLMMIDGFEFGRNPGRLIFREETRKGHDSLPRGILEVFVEFRGQPDLFWLPRWLFKKHVRPHW